MAEEPLAHLLRPALPWRKARKTECGRPEPDVERVTTAEEYVNKDPEERARLPLCSTCVMARDRHGLRQVSGHTSWWEAPTDVLRRELPHWGGDSLTDDELRAVGRLVERYRDDFDALLAQISGGNDLQAARERREERTPGPRFPGTTL